MTMSANKLITSIYTDGACLGNPGPGGWGIVVYYDDGSIVEIGDRQTHTTNNRMEMQAAISALKFISNSGQSQGITLFTDSEYVKKGITQWIQGWKHKGWKNSQGKPVLNQDLWQNLDQLNSKQVHWEYVRGHSGNPGNERSDAIATGFARGNPPPLKGQVSVETITPLTETNPLTVTGLSDSNTKRGYKDNHTAQSHPNNTMLESAPNLIEDQQLPREVRVNQLRNLIDTLRIADEVAKQGYLISSSELADLMDINASAVTSRGDHWSWRNWVVSRVRREGNQILWQLERVD